MLLSMTGYGKESCIFSGKTCTVEIKSVNSKNLDLSTRIPASLKDREMELRKLLSSDLIRGKIDLNISISNDEKDRTINTDAAKAYYKDIVSLSKKLGIKEGFEAVHAVSPKNNETYLSHLLFAGTWSDQARAHLCTRRFSGI